MKVQGILATKSSTVITIGRAQQIREALALLAKHNVGALVVVDDNNSPIGVISERDIVREAARREDLFGDPVERIMTSPVIVGVYQDDLYSVAHTMEVKRIRHLPIVDKGQLVGIISIGDVLKAQRNAFRGEASTLEIQLTADKKASH